MNYSDMSPWKKAKEIWKFMCSNILLEFLIGWFITDVL